jgi:hypothetical protein
LFYSYITRYELCEHNSKLWDELSMDGLDSRAPTVDADKDEDISEPEDDFDHELGDDIDHSRCNR